MASHQAIGLVDSSVEKSTKDEVLSFGLKMTWLNVEKNGKKMSSHVASLQARKKRFLINLNRNEMKT